MNIINDEIELNKLNLLMNLIGKINSNLEVEILLKEIMESTKIMMDSEASSLFILSKDKKKLTLTIPTGPATAEISGKSIDSDHGIVGWVTQNEKSVVVNNVQIDHRFKGEITELNNFITRNLISVPLINHNGVLIGTLQAINRKDNKDFEEKLVPIFQSLANQAAIAIENAMLQKQLIEKERIDKELQVARIIQSGFWPKETPNIVNYSVAGCSRTAKSVGGDYYDYIKIPDSLNWGFTVSDVSGKGVPASLLMATMRASLRSHVENQFNVSESMKKVNKLIYEDSPIDKFITSIYGTLDTENHTFTYVNAGHNNPFIIRLEENKLEELKVGGVMLGIMDPVEFEEDTAYLNPGDKLILFSDGITEAQNTKGEFFEDERFEEWLLTNKNKSPFNMMIDLLNDLVEFSNGEPQSDDITIIILEREK